MLSSFGQAVTLAAVWPLLVLSASDHDRVARATDLLLRVDSSMVLVPVHVSSAAGSPITNLVRENFRLTEDGVDQRISYFAKDDGPISVALLFDTSGSMKNKIRKSSEAAAAFFRLANPEDEFFLVEFSDRAKLAMPFTRNADDLYAKILNAHPDGRTALLDAVHLATRYLKKARHERKAIVIISDGGDNSSSHSARQVRQEMVESDAILYAMGIFDSGYAVNHVWEEKNGPKLLDEIATQTGGSLYMVDQLNDLPAISAHIGEQLRSQYLLGFKPETQTGDGKYRKLKVEVSNVNSAPVLRTDYRRGYYAH